MRTGATKRCVYALVVSCLITISACAVSPANSVGDTRRCGAPTTSDVKVGSTGYDLSIRSGDNGGQYTLASGRTILVIFRCGEPGDPGYAPSPVNAGSDIEGGPVLAMVIEGTDKAGDSFGLYRATRVGDALLQVAVSTPGCTGDNCGATRVTWSVSIHVVSGA